MPTHFSPKFVGVGAPLRDAYDGIAITANDSVDIPAGPGGPVNTPCIGLYVGSTGNVAATTPSGVAVTLTAVPAGTILDVALKRVLATGTTASQLSALFAPQM